MAYLRELIEAQSPPSLALAAIERYLASKRNVLNLIVPLGALGLPSNLELEKPVYVQFMPARRNKLMLGRRNERLHLRWKPDGPYPAFEGFLAIRPWSGKTQIELRGSYEPPFGALGEAFDSAVGYRIAHATAHALLNDLKEELERDFAAVKATIETGP
jgi:hypothetical protein